jgi:hypothetical protein
MRINAQDWPARQSGSEQATEIGMRIRHAALALVCAALAAPAAADDPPGAESPWRIVLEGQLKKEKGCDLNEVMSFQEVPIGDDVGLDGRVSCFDGREFTFTRKKKHQKFTIEICEPSVC